MRRYNLLIAFSAAVYVVLAFAAGYGLLKSEARRSQVYKVEINRVLESLSEGNSPDGLDLRSCGTIEEVHYISIKEMENQKKAEAFSEGKNRTQTVIRPLYQKGRLIGLLRFDCTWPAFNVRSYMILIQVCLGIMELFVLFVLLYLKYKLLKPFEQASDVPEALAKGHLKGVVKEEKNQYLGRFLWGVGQLKDNLDAARKREIELVREKKRLLLSLSHDIKTPLNSIKLYGKALEEGLYREESERKHAAQKIGIKVSQIEGYLAEIIKSSREDILDIQVKKGEFYLRDLIDQIRAAYGEECEIRMMELKIARFDNLLLKGDIDRALEVAENLFENAFKYGDGRRIEITFEEEDYCKLIRVFNTGDCVSETEYNHIFESFFRGANSEGKKGYGLGLYICREIMRRMDGEIYAQREPDGMAFVLVFQE